MSFSYRSLVLALVLAGCSNPAENAPQAQVAPAQPPAEQAAPAAPAQATTYRFDGTNSKIEFVGAKVTGSHNGSFGTFTGTVRLAGDDVSRATLAVEIETASITADVERLTGHLKSPELLDVAQFPKSRFTSTSIVRNTNRGGVDPNVYNVTGNFALHGQTRAITFPASIRLNGGTLETDAEFAIDRRDFGIVYPGMPDDLIKDEVLIKLTIRAAR
jgi:polyisoprenoid-binding protein YceI